FSSYQDAAALSPAAMALRLGVAPPVEGGPAPMWRVAHSMPRFAGSFLPVRPPEGSDPVLLRPHPEEPGPTVGAGTRAAATTTAPRTSMPAAVSASCIPRRVAPVVPTAPTMTTGCARRPA